MPEQKTTLEKSEFSTRLPCESSGARPEILDTRTLGGSRLLVGINCSWYLSPSYCSRMGIPCKKYLEAEENLRVN